MFAVIKYARYFTPNPKETNSSQIHLLLKHPEQAKKLYKGGGLCLKAGKEEISRSQECWEWRGWMPNWHTPLIMGWQTWEFFFGGREIKKYWDVQVSKAGCEKKRWTTENEQALKEQKGYRVCKCFVQGVLRTHSLSWTSLSTHRKENRKQRDTQKLNGSNGRREAQATFVLSPEVLRQAVHLGPFGYQHGSGCPFLLNICFVKTTNDCFRHKALGCGTRGHGSRSLESFCPWHLGLVISQLISGLGSVYYSPPAQAKGSNRFW